MARQFFASEYAYGANKAVEGATVVVGASATGAQTVVVSPGQMATQFGRVFIPFNTNAPILIGAGSNQETVTPSAVTINYGATQSAPGPVTAAVTATFSNVQGQGSMVASGTFGLQEAINAASATGGGCVIVDSLWVSYGGTTAMLLAAVNGTNIVILDERGTPGTFTSYGWNGTAFISTPGASLIGANGQSFTPFHNTELITISTSGSTSDSVANLLPANSLIMLVTGYVQTGIGTSTTWELGDPTTAARFSTTSSAVTAGSIIPTTSIPPVQIGTGVANATTGIWQLVAAKVRITTSGTSTAGKVRVDVYGFTVTLPTS